MTFICAMCEKVADRGAAEGTYGFVRIYCHHCQARAESMARHPSKSPVRTPEMIDSGQFWVWMGDHWEIRGTGLVT